MFLLILTLSTLFVSISVATLFLYRRFWAHQYFERLGIPGPRPHWLFGNLLGLADEHRRHLQLAEWTDQFGGIYGYYEGPSPVLVISDVDAINNVFIKQFSTFHARKLYHFQPDPDDPNELISVFFARGDRWKRLRTIINPAFSTKKMREMAPRMQIYQKNFLRLLERKEGQSVNIFDLFQLLTIDVIAECAFGIEMNSIKSEGRGNPTLQRIKKMMRDTFKIPFILLITTVLTELKPLFAAYVRLGQWLKIGIGAPTAWIYVTVRKIVQGRKNVKGNKQSDLLQLLLDGDEVSGEEIVSEKSATTLNRGGEVLKALTSEEIEARVYIMLVAGYETTSNVLAYIAYELAINPEIQDRLIQEIDGSFSDVDQDIDYDAVTAKKMPYMDAVINETLRKYPVGLMVANRIAMEETTLLGYDIPKGLPAQPDVWSLHQNPEIWGPVDPAKFYPERWLEDHEGDIVKQHRETGFLSFGLGPRICIGMRFAQLEIKLTLVYMLRRFRIVRCPETKVPLNIQVAHTMTPKDGVWIALESRSDRP